MSFEEKYPFIASWVVDGQIHIGQTESYEPFAAVIDQGGIVWETNEPFSSLDALFDEMEKGISRWCHEHGIELIDHQGRSLLWPED